MPPNNGIIIVPRAKGGNTASTQNNSSGAAKIRIIQFPKRLGVTILRKMRRIFVDGANAYENGDYVGVGRSVLGFGVTVLMTAITLKGAKTTRGPPKGRPK